MLALLSAPLHAQPIRSYYIDEPVFGGQAYVREAGQPDRPALILIHGLNDSSALWEPYIPALAANLHVITFDLPGFGRSDKGNKLYSPQNYVAFVRHIVGLTRHKKVQLVGHSLGANIALQYAHRYPQQVESLVLVSTAGVIHRLAYTQFLTHFGIQRIPELYGEQRNDLGALAEELFGTLADNAALVELGEQYLLSQPLLRENLLGGQPAAIAAHAMLLSEISQEFFTQAIPTLLLWGGEDRVTPVRTGKLLAANMQTAGLVVLDGIGHNPLRERPAQMARWLGQYLNADGARRAAILTEHRYTRPAQDPADAERIGYCDNEAGKVFRGTYKLIVIENCRDVRLEQVHATSVSILRSTASIDASIIESHGKALLLQESEVVSTAILLRGQPALSLSGSRLDMAGAQLYSESYALFNPAASGATTSQHSRIMFSVSQLQSQYFKRYLHGPLNLLPGQGM